MKPVVLTPGEGERLAMGPARVAIKATGADTAGTFYLGEVEPARLPGPPPHVHEKLHDMFFVIDGTLTMRLGGEEREVAPGTFVCVPPGVVHSFSNRGEGAGAIPELQHSGRLGGVHARSRRRFERGGARRPRRRLAGSHPDTTSARSDRRTRSL